MSEDKPRVANHANGPNEDLPAGEASSKPAKKERAWSEGLLFVLVVFAASRLLYLISGPILARVVPVGWFYRTTPDKPFGTLNVWSHWDGVWYIQIAERGYEAAAPPLPPSSRCTLCS